MVGRMAKAADCTYWGMFGLMALLVVGASRKSGFLARFPLLVPAAMPLLFLAIFAGWLWWYGHNLNDLGAFTLKPFMPTVFGDGKVAQFTTKSYPHVGFGVMLLFSGLIAAAGLLRLNRDAAGPGGAEGG